MNAIHSPKKGIDLKELAPLATHPTEEVAKWEGRYEGQLAHLADTLAQSHGEVRVLLLSGPSASGKTTTAYKISALLGERGIEAPVVSLDDFFIGVDSYPRLPDGTPDFESIDCLDRELFTVTIQCLLNYGKAVFPVYDFTLGTRSDEVRNISLGAGNILIIEGIHALNPLLSRDLPQNKLFKAYVSVVSPFTDGEEELLAPREVRLIRRMTRDNFYRGYPPHLTLERWENVLDGEKRWILPFRGEAQLEIDSAIGYEPCIFGHFLLPALAGEELEQFSQVLGKLREALARFPVLPRRHIPKHSLLREFISEK